MLILSVTSQMWCATRQIRAGAATNVISPRSPSPVTAMPSRARPQAPTSARCVSPTYVSLFAGLRRTAVPVNIRVRSQPPNVPTTSRASLRPSVHHSSSALKIKPFIGLMSRALASETSLRVLESAWPDRQPATNCLPRRPR